MDSAARILKSEIERCEVRYDGRSVCNGANRGETQGTLLTRRAGASAVYDGNAPIMTFPSLDALLMVHGIAEGPLLEMKLALQAMLPARAVDHSGTTTRGTSPIRRARRANCLSSKEAMLSQPR